MSKLDDYYCQGITYISDNSDIIKGYTYIELGQNRGFNPVCFSNDDLEFIRKYEYIMERLKEDNKILIEHHTMYIGKEMGEGPYLESKVFTSECDSSNLYLKEMFKELDDKLKKRQQSQKRLIRLGAGPLNYVENKTNINN